MKFALAVFAILAMFVCFVSSIPIEQDSKGQAILNRDRRATCDLLSFDTKFGSLNHSACAAHCLFKGYKGGRCKNAICHCRN